MNGLFREQGRNALYLGMEVPRGRLAALAPAFLELPFDGFNLTYPLKEEALPLCVELSEQARRVGAVNTLVRTPEGWRGLTTDGDGLLLYLEECRGWRPEGNRVVVLGAGGAARSALAALALRDLAGLVVVNRSPRRFEEPFFQWLRTRGGRCRVPDDPELIPELAAADLLIHATPFGLGAGGGTPCWNLSALTPGTRVVDMNYRLGGPTPFLEWIGSDFRREDGRGMLAGQAVLGFQAWTGERPAVSEALLHGGLGAL